MPFVCGNRRSARGKNGTKGLSLDTCRMAQLPLTSIFRSTHMERMTHLLHRSEPIGQSMSKNFTMSIFIEESFVILSVFGYIL